MTMQQNGATILQKLAEFKRDQQVHNTELAEATGTEPGRTNDAVQILEDSRYVQVVRTLGNAPFDFNGLRIVPAGRHELERAEAAAATTERAGNEPQVRPSPWPAGSPFGFHDEDWEFIIRERKSEQFIVVFGHQFESEYYDLEVLSGNLETQFGVALATAQNEVGTNLSLDFRQLEAG